MSERCSGLYREVARYCGMDAAKALYANYAGAAVKFPKNLTQEHQLAQRLGLDIAKRLCDHFGYVQIEIPVRWLSGGELEDEVRERVGRGEKINDIARALRTPRRTIQRMIKPEKQPTLFEM